MLNSVNTAPSLQATILMAACAFQITLPMGVLAAHAQVEALITVKDIKGSYVIPYIQSDRELRVRVTLTRSSRSD